MDVIIFVKLKAPISIMTNQGSQEDDSKKHKFYQIQITEKCKFTSRTKKVLKCGRCVD
jgi:hypothetical protein